MASIEDLERDQLRREVTLDTQSSGVQSVPRKKLPNLTMIKLMVRDSNKTIRVRTGLSEDEFHHVLSLLEESPEAVKRGKRLLDLEVRLVIILQWIHHSQTFDKLASSIGLTNSRVQTAITSLWDKLADVLMKDQVPSRRDLEETHFLGESPLISR